MRKHHPFPAADEDVRAADGVPSTPATETPSYRLAFDDPEFLLRDELRGIRLQLELLKPELTFNQEKIASTIVVFGSARTRPQRDPVGDAPAPAVESRRNFDEARRFARLVSEAGQQSGVREYVVVTGGGPGIMEAANQGAHDVDAESIALGIVLPREEAPNAYATPKLTFRFHYFAIRKMHFLLRARALVCFPGGFGTLDELFETLTLIQTGKMDRIPVLLFDRRFWQRIINFDALVEEGVISPQDVEIFRFVESADEAWEFIRRFYAEAPLPEQPGATIRG